MRKERKKEHKSIIIFCFMAILLLCGCQADTLEHRLEKQTEKTAQYVKQSVPAPRVSAVGGDWAVKGIAESGLSVEADYFDSYYDNVRAVVKSSGGNLHEQYYSDYARVIIALEAIGKDAASVEGYDLTKQLDSYKQLTEQGGNAAAYTLAAIHLTGTKSVYEKDYVSFLISELKALTENKTTDRCDDAAMYVLGLSFYQGDAEVKAVTEQGVAYLSERQKENGTMGSCETTAETIIALTQLDIDVFSDKRFVKNGNSIGESLMRYAEKNGAFSHTEEEKQANAFASEKALLALCSMKKQEKGEKLYERR